jgi:hypothetical protein
VRRAPPPQVPHAPEYGTGRDAAPEPVGDPEFPFDHQVPDVVRQRSPGTAAQQLVDDSVVAFYKRIGDLVVRQTRKRDTHIPTMRTGGAASITIFGSRARVPRR